MLNLKDVDEALWLCNNVFCGLVELWSCWQHSYAEVMIVVTCRTPTYYSDHSLHHDMNTRRNLVPSGNCRMVRSSWV